MKRKLSLAVAVLLLGAPYAQAEDGKLWPTDLVSLGDCVTARITAPRNEAQDKADTLYCTKGNVGQPEKIQTCIENSQSRSEIAFFTDKCGSDEGKFYISLNGKEYMLRRVMAAPGSPVSFAGEYAGDNIKVEILPGRDLTKPSEDPDFDEVEFEVSVTVSKEKRTEKINGIFWQGH